VRGHGVGSPVRGHGVCSLDNRETLLELRSELRLDALPATFQPVIRTHDSLRANRVLPLIRVTIKPRPRLSLICKPIIAMICSKGQGNSRSKTSEGLQPPTYTLEIISVGVLTT